MNEQRPKTGFHVRIDQEQLESTGGFVQTPVEIRSFLGFSLSSQSCQRIKILKLTDSLTGFLSRESADGTENGRGIGSGQKAIFHFIRIIDISLCGFRR
jgi:hypothetical protein